MQDDKFLDNNMFIAIILKLISIFYLFLPMWNMSIDWSFLNEKPYIVIIKNKYVLEKC